MVTACPALTFVYDADSSLLTKAQRQLRYWLRRQSPEPCALRTLTCDVFGLREQWRQAVEALPAGVAFLHRDEFRHAYPVLQDVALPAVLYDDGLSGLQPLISAEELRQLDLTGLITATQQRCGALVG